MRRFFLNKPGLLIVGAYLLWSGYQFYDMQTCQGFLCSMDGYVLIGGLWLWVFAWAQFSDSWSEWVIPICMVLNILLLLGIGFGIDVLARSVFPRQTTWISSHLRSVLITGAACVILILLVSSFLPRYNCHNGEPSDYRWHCHTWWTPTHDHYLDKNL